MKKKIPYIIITILFVLMLAFAILFINFYGLYYDLYDHEVEVVIEDFKFYEGKPSIILLSEDSEYKIEIMFLWEVDSLTHHQILYKKGDKWVSATHKNEN